jgi:hypothetical protein
MKKHLLYSVVFAFILGMNVFAQEILLPDQIFTIKVTEKNASGTTETMPADELILKANQISSTFGTKNGFAAVPYSIKQQGAPNSFMLDFTAESTNSKKDVLKWSGTINGNSVSGKAQRIRNGKPAGEYTFTGTRKKKK